ncbi:MAG: ABC transporter permease, partial [Fusobacterium mortiferum]
MKNKKHYAIVGGILLLLSIPVLGTLLYSISSVWEASILPEGFSIKWYGQLLGDMRFLIALKRSFVLSIVALGVTLFILIPSIVI